MSHILPANQNFPTQQTEISLESETISDTTQQILDIAKNVTAPLNQSDTIELAKVGGQTAENIFSILIKSGGKPVAVILATAILVASTALPIVALGQYQKTVFDSQRQETIRK
jgi:hypothetical protein